MEEERRLTIGEFAGLSGLTARALRIYADAGILAPAHVDATNGYRTYERAQLERAEQVRLLRAAGVAVSDVAEILDAPPKEATARLDEHLSALDASHAQAHAAVRLVRARLTTSRPGVAMSTAMIEREALASAVDAASRCCTTDPDLASSPLAGLRCRVDAEGLHFVGSDKYSAAFIDLACTWTSKAEGERLVPPGFLSSASGAWPSMVAVELIEDGLIVNGDTVPTLAEQFPDVDKFIPYLSRLTTGCVVSKSALLAALPLSDVADDDEPAVELEFIAGAQKLLVTQRGRDQTLEKAAHRRPTRIDAVGEQPMEPTWVSPSRLRSILAGVGENVVLALARIEPVAIGDVSNERQRFLLMPMASVNEAPLPPGVSA